MALSAFKPARSNIVGLRSSHFKHFRNAESGGRPAHVVKAPRDGRNVLAHARSRVEAPIGRAAPEMLARTTSSSSLNMGAIVGTVGNDRSAREQHQLVAR